MLYLLNVVFYVLHTLLIAFNMTGWAWQRTRALHLVSIGATTFSWFALGATYGWGYCLCTDWHFQVREKLGYTVSESSYLQLLAHPLGINLSARESDWLAGSVFVLIIVATTATWANVLKQRKGRLPRTAEATPSLICYDINDSRTTR